MLLPEQYNKKCLKNTKKKVLIKITVLAEYSCKHKNSFFHEKVKSGRQVLKSPQNPFFLNTLTKINFEKC